MPRAPFHPALVAATAGLLLLLALFATGCGSSDDPPPPAKVEPYRAWLEESSANLVRMTGRLLADVEAGQLREAEARYASTRVFYGHVQPAAASFNDLDERVDGGDARGFHRIERELAEKRAPRAMTPVARKLLADVKELQREIKTSPLKAGQIADSADALLNDVAIYTINGGEEAYTHIDLVDVAARIEAVEAAFKALKPPLLDEDPELVEEIEKGFAKVYDTLRPWGRAAREPDQPRPQEPGVAFVLYSQLIGGAVNTLTEPIDALLESFSRVPEEIAQE